MDCQPSYFARPILHQDTNIELSKEDLTTYLPNEPPCVDFGWPLFLFYPFGFELLFLLVFNCILICFFFIYIN